MVSGILLREARLRAGLSQAELARRAGKARSAIGRWERGEVQPSFETLRELVRACGLDIGYGVYKYDDHDALLARDSLRSSPAQRLRSAVRAANMLHRAAVNAASADG
ncbi:MAG: helix-turn-helix transcriptional regulator [Actinobacteria bacterium]|nr:helix-turn-helix transcriptional regulator [Actinomycetota bacterium]